MLLMYEFKIIENRFTYMIVETLLKQITKKREKEHNIEKEKPFKIKDFKGF